MRKRQVSRGWLYLVAIVVAVGTLTWVQVSIKSLGDDLGQTRADLQQTRADNVALAKQVKALGGTPVVKPSDPDDATMTPASVRVIVAEELAKSDLKLSPSQVSLIASAAATKVPKPKDGVTPSVAQVQGVVSATIKTFCAQDSKPCQGDAGPKGQDAPPITEAQLSAAVGAFCGADAARCQGRGIASIAKSGETVTVTYTDDSKATFTVADGDPGRGITSGPTCMGDGADSYWLTKYTDGTEQRQDVQCEAVPVAPPSGDPNK